MMCCSEGPGSGLFGAGDGDPHSAGGQVHHAGWAPPRAGRTTKVSRVIWMTLKWLGQCVTALAAQKELRCLGLTEASRVVTCVYG